MEDDVVATVRARLTRVIDDVLADDAVGRVVPGKVALAFELEAIAGLVAATWLPGFLPVGLARLITDAPATPAALVPSRHERLGWAPIELPALRAAATAWLFSPEVAARRQAMLRETSEADAAALHRDRTKPDLVLFARMLGGPNSEEQQAEEAFFRERAEALLAQERAMLDVIASIDVYPPARLWNAIHAAAVVIARPAIEAGFLLRGSGGTRTAPGIGRAIVLTAIGRLRRALDDTFPATDHGGSGRGGHGPYRASAAPAAQPGLDDDAFDHRLEQAGLDELLEGSLDHAVLRGRIGELPIGVAALHEDVRRIATSDMREAFHGHALMQRAQTMEIATFRCEIPGTLLYEAILQAHGAAQGVHAVQVSKHHATLIGIPQLVAALERLSFLCCVTAGVPGSRAALTAEVLDANRGGALATGRSPAVFATLVGALAAGPFFDRVSSAEQAFAKRLQAEAERSEAKGAIRWFDVLNVFSDAPAEARAEAADAAASQAGEDGNTHVRAARVHLDAALALVPAANVAIDVELLHASATSIRPYLDPLGRAVAQGLIDCQAALRSWTERAHVSLGPIFPGGDVIAGYARRRVG